MESHIDGYTLSNLQLTSCADETSWLDRMREKIENGTRGFDPRAVVQDCAKAAKLGKGMSRGIIFTSLKSAGFGPLLGCDQLF